MSWIAGGVFTPMFHRVLDDAESMLLDHRRYWWSICDHICVPIPPEIDINHVYWPWCPTCFPSQHAIDTAKAAWANNTPTETTNQEARSRMPHIVTSEAGETHDCECKRCSGGCGQRVWYAKGRVVPNKPLCDQCVHVDHR